MALANNLGNLICDIESEYHRSYNEVKDFTYLEEVDKFLSRRKKDLLTFKKLTSGYLRSVSIATVVADLKDTYPRYSKYYGGICLKGADYFKLTKKVKKAIDNEINELQKQAYEALEQESLLTFDESFCIPDELDQDTMNKIYK